MSILLNTVIGSHLYGTNHAESDYDYYVVTSNYYEIDGVKKQIKTTQILANGTDTVTLPLSKFMIMADKGVPQALEAMFSNLATVDVLHDMRKNFYVNPVNMLSTYTSTIASHIGRGFYLDDFKVKKHAVRLAFNLRDGLKYGRFNPQLNGEDKVLMHFIAQLKQEDLKQMIDDYVGVELEMSVDPF